MDETILLASYAIYDKPENIGYTDIQTCIGLLMVTSAPTLRDKF